MGRDKATILRFLRGKQATDIRTRMSSGVAATPIPAPELRRPARDGEHSRQGIAPEAAGESRTASCPLSQHGVRETTLPPQPSSGVELLRATAHSTPPGVEAPTSAGDAIADFLFFTMMPHGGRWSCDPATAHALAAELLDELELQGFTISRVQ